MESDDIEAAEFRQLPTAMDRARNRYANVFLQPASNVGLVRAKEPVPANMDRRLQA